MGKMSMKDGGGHGSRKTTRPAPQPTKRASIAGLRKTPNDAAPKKMG